MMDEVLPVVLPASTTSTLSLSLHPLPILNISEHLTRSRLQNNSTAAFGALLGTQNGREVEIVNSFELLVAESDDKTALKVDHEFMVSRTQQFKQVFPSLELIGWYNVSPYPKPLHLLLHEQFTEYMSTPLLLLLDPSEPNPGVDTQSLPLKAFEPTFEIRDRRSRSVYIGASYTVQTGEAERIAVDWTAKGGGSGSSLVSHLHTQKAAVKMLHDRIEVLSSYLASVIAGSSPKDHTALRSLSALLASLPAADNAEFKEEFDKEYTDVQMTSYLAMLTKSATVLNDLVDKHVVTSSSSRDSGIRGMRRRPGMMGELDTARFR